MAGNRADWSILRGTVIGFALCVLVAGGMLAASYYFRQTMQAQYADSHRKFIAASGQYLAVDEEERIIDEYYPAFVRLYRRGLIGEERRLSWIESLRNASNALRLPELDYQLDAQRTVDLDYPLDHGAYDVRMSAMTLTVGMVHEGDLLRLLDTLDREAAGQYSVRECDLTLEPGAAEISAAVANIHASCTLEWLTLNLAGGQELRL